MWPLQVHKGERRAPPGAGLKTSPHITYCCSFLTSGNLQWPDLHSSPLQTIHFKRDTARLDSFKSVSSHTPLLKHQTQATGGSKDHQNSYHGALKVAAGMRLDSQYPFSVYKLPNAFTTILSCFLKASLLYPCPCPNAPHNLRSWLNWLQGKHTDGFGYQAWQNKQPETH